MGAEMVVMMYQQDVPPRISKPRCLFSIYQHRVEVNGVNSPWGSRHGGSGSKEAESGRIRAHSRVAESLDMAGGWFTNKTWAELERMRVAHFFMKGYVSEMSAKISQVNGRKRLKWWEEELFGPTTPRFPHKRCFQFILFYIDIYGFSKAIYFRAVNYVVE